MVGESGDFCVVGRGVDGVVGIGIVVWTVVSGDSVFRFVGNFSTILNVVVLVTSMVSPDTVTTYSSGLKVDASTSNDQWLNPFVPGSTLTVPADPENSPLCTFCVGLNDDEVISIIRLFPTARLVEPLIVNLSPTA